VFEKLPAFFAWVFWRGVGLELVVPQPASERLKAAAKRELESGETERVFIFMATDWPLANIANLAGVAVGMFSSDVALYHTPGAMGNRGYFRGYLLRVLAEIG
jgi:hypothetical protein